MSEYTKHERRRSQIIFWSAVVLTIVAAAASWWLTGPPPPKQIIIATGLEGGAYDRFGKLYKSRLEEMGLKVRLLNTNGAIDNLERLAKGQVDVAFTQGGVAESMQHSSDDLRGIAALYLEAIWVFSRSGVNVSRLSDLKDHSVAIGPASSGTEMVARQLLEAHGVTGSNARTLNMTAVEAGQALITGTLDAAIVVSSPQGEVVQRLLRTRDIALMNFAGQDMAHTRLFPFLRTVKLYAGIIDLKDNLPSTDKTLLAPAALLVCREGLHAQVVEQLYNVITAIHSNGDLFSAPHTFPTLEGVDLPIHETAEAYARSGESFIGRNLPYWAVRWLWRLRVLLLPLLAVWIPALKFLPQFLGFWGMRVIKRHYRLLRDLESSVSQARTPEELRQSIVELEALRDSMWGKTHRIPAFLQPNIYQWRVHVSDVCAEAEERLRRMTSADSA